MCSDNTLACDITIITPTLDRGELLVDAIESIDCAGDRLLEHLIVDGGTDDLTREVVSGYSHLLHIREPDRGVYDAFNKGLKAASGEVVGFLNSDDLLEKGALQSVTRIFMQHKEVDIVSGGAVLESLDSGEVINFYNRESNKVINLENITFGSPVFNAHFFRKSVFDRLGSFDPDLPLLADREFLLRVALAGLNNRIISDVVYRYRAHPGSLTFAGRGKTFDGIGSERLWISEKYLDSGLLDAAGKRIMRAWHTDGAAVELALNIRRMQWSSLPGIFSRTSRYNRAWRGALAGSVLRKLAPAFIRKLLAR
jgi:glycosyltransferase involved in cell wall biosynthesis